MILCYCGSFNLVDDLPKILASTKIGTNRIREIVLSLRNFSLLDEAEIGR